jgi:hypothetical protein
MSALSTSVLHDNLLYVGPLESRLSRQPQHDSEPLASLVAGPLQCQIVKHLFAVSSEYLQKSQYIYILCDALMDIVDIASNAMYCICSCQRLQHLPQVTLKNWDMEQATNWYSSISSVVSSEVHHFFQTGTELLNLQHLTGSDLHNFRLLRGHSSRPVKGVLEERQGYDTRITRGWSSTTLA